MHNVILGTAGHVDHGKTALVKALTGTDPDRLKEEKARGMTIEPGFAALIREPDLKIGVIDVPGHEKFVRNMLTGIGGIDLALLVIDLTEGIKPQTIEHFSILRALCVPEGIVVFTKADLSDPEREREIRRETDRLLAGSFLEKAERRKVSSLTGEGIPELKALIFEKAEKIRRRSSERGKFRLPIDRVFVKEGFGTIVTGTVTEGSIGLREEIMLYPEGRKLAVRGIEVYGKPQTEAFAGQRAALNLPNIGKEEIERGMVLAFPESLIPTELCDAEITLFPEAGELKNGSRVLVCSASWQKEAKAVLPETDLLRKGESGACQLRFAEKLPLSRGDRLIIRSLNPPVSLGGGRVLDSLPKKRKRKTESGTAGLSLLRSGSDREALSFFLESAVFPVFSLPELSIRLSRSREETEALLSGLSADSSCVRKDGFVIPVSFCEKGRETAEQILESFYEQSSLSSGMQKRVFLSALSGKYYTKETKKLAAVLSLLLEQGAVEEKDGMICLPGRTVMLTKEAKELLFRIERRFLDTAYHPLSSAEGLAGCPAPLGGLCFRRLLDEGKIVRLEKGHYLHRSYLQKTLFLIRRIFAENEILRVSALRKETGADREDLITILSYFDRKHITVPENGVRKSGRAAWRV